LASIDLVLFMKKILILLLTLNTIIFAALNPSTPIEQYIEYGKCDHFAAVGGLEIRSADGSLSDWGTGVLVKTSQYKGISPYVLTAAHNFDGVPELGRDNMIFHLNGEMHRIIDYILHPDFRKGGPDLAVAILSEAILGSLAIIGAISNEDLSTRIWDGIPSFEEHQSGISRNKTYEFSSAGFGRVGSWDQAPKIFQRHKERIGFNIDLQGAIVQSASAQYPIPEKVFRFPVSKDMELSGGSNFGFTGSPVFMRNYTIPTGVWRIIGVLKAGGNTAAGWDSTLTPINKDPWLGDILDGRKK
jgi:hypothetical protein